MTSVIDATNNIRHLIDQLQEKFDQQQEPVDRKDKAYFEVVKKETAPMFELNDQWLELASEYVKNREVKVHPNQVKSTHENIELLILHSYFFDVKKKRYRELNHSVHYVLDMIVDN
ncbi:DUF1798 family protein [Thalassobacillus hwangdonensis]|uniref:DUF1798 family protein n=1 Tax=Thalassobacillus hwangdonensis TaxID=546108 RepID=A0ABW3KZA9_9BACI